ncbi:zinc carboxypeptidase-like [Cydia strobilella]|uniref:zinc carboxypeptidase-like n=1 Tax=Cydia strobilella TaxID=1100964 RepID=UPI003005CBB9
MYYITTILAIASVCDGLTYRNYALLHGMPRNDRELKFFNDMVKLYNVTYWRRPGKVMRPVEFTISPYNYGELMIDTYRTKIRFRTIMEDVQSAFDEQTIKHYFRHHLDSFNWDNYHSLDDIYTWLKDLSGAHPEEVQLLHIGKSFENRDIFAVKLKLNKIKICKKRHRPKIIIEGGSHGREWISPAVVTYMIHALLNANNSNSEELKLVAPMYDWFFVPVMNPDGYVYSQTQDRLWKKNRRGGYGVDLNRNFGILFGKQGAKTDKRDDEYCGKEPFSEPESAAMATLARDNSFSLDYYLSFHAYGQYIILPYSFSKMYEDNYNSTKKLADMMAQKLFTKYQVQYKVGTNFDTQGYLASGVSADWVKRAINVTHVATIMLPDTGVFGFALPTNQILPTCQAILDGLLAFLDPPNPEDLLNREVRRLGDIPKEEDSIFEFYDDSATLENYASSRILFVCNVIVYMFSRFL